MVQNVKSPDQPVHVVMQQLTQSSPNVQLAAMTTSRAGPPAVSIQRVQRVPFAQGTHAVVVQHVPQTAQPSLQGQPLLQGVASARASPVAPYMAPLVAQPVAQPVEPAVASAIAPPATPVAPPLAPNDAIPTAAPTPAQPTQRKKKKGQKFLNRPPYRHQQTHKYVGLIIVCRSRVI